MKWKNKTPKDGVGPGTSCPPPRLPSVLTQSWPRLPQDQRRPFEDCLCCVYSLFTCQLARCLIYSNPQWLEPGPLRAVCWGLCGNSSLGSLVTCFCESKIKAKPALG